MTPPSTWGAPPISEAERERRAIELAKALGLMERRSKRSKRGGPSCEDCYFHRHLLCALDLDGPCATFRPDSPDGLAPPLQPALLPRRADGELQEAA